MRIRRRRIFIFVNVQRGGISWQLSVIHLNLSVVQNVLENAYQIVETFRMILTKTSLRSLFYLQPLLVFPALTPPNFSSIRASMSPALELSQHATLTASPLHCTVHIALCSARINRPQDMCRRVSNCARQSESFERHSGVGTVPLVGGVPKRRVEEPSQ